MRLFHINMCQKKDWILISAIVAAAFLSAILTAWAHSSTGKLLRITINGELYGEYSLSEDQVIMIEQQSGYNKIVIENNAAYVEEADCPDGYCMDYKPVSKGNETIICLPHKLVLEVIGASNQNQPDVIVQ